MATSCDGLDSGDGPPPLEDMTEQLEKIMQQRKWTQTKTSPKTARDSEKHGNTNTPSQKDQKQSQRESKSSKKSSSGASFGGFQKGFLSGSQTPGSRSSKTIPTKKSGAAKNVSERVIDDDIIRPKISAQNSKSSGLEFPEVQEAMKESFPFLNTESWLTDSILAKIEKDPVLCNAFKDPALSQALAQFQANPQEALTATRDKPEIQKFLQSFCTLMGEHFTTLGNSEEKAKSGAPISEIVSEEETLMKKILAKPEVKDVLRDPLIQSLIETMKSDPESAQRLFYTGSPDFKQKVKVLVDNGLLAIQPSFNNNNNNNNN